MRRFLKSINRAKSDFEDAVKIMKGLELELVQDADFMVSFTPRIRSYL